MPSLEKAMACLKAAAAELDDKIGGKAGWV